MYRYLVLIVISVIIFTIIILKIPICTVDLYDIE